MKPRKQIWRLPASISSLILLTSIPLAAAELTLTDDSKCGCYLTNGTNSGYFTGHRFFDFRNLSEYAGVPAVIRDADATPDADETSAFFTTPEWTDFWMPANWNNSNGGGSTDATLLMINSPNNIYIEAAANNTTSPQTWLTLRTQRLPSFQTAAELESTSSQYKYLSLRMRARTLGSPGAVTAMFTYRASDTLAAVQESDLEIRTSDPRNLVRYTNQPAYTDAGGTVEQASLNGTMPRGMEWTEWAVHRMDWTPGVTTWFVDGERVAELEFQTPRDECGVLLNAWSDGGEWSGEMGVGEAAYLQVQWLEVVFNRTEGVEGKVKRDGDGICNRVCSVDQTSQLGRPVMLWDNAAVPVGTPGEMVAWLPTVAVFLVTLLSAVG